MNKVEQHRKICEELNDTYKKKNSDYGSSFDEIFEEFGPISALTRIADKYNRLKSLMLNNKQMVKDEAIEDTLTDMANYCIMFRMALENEKTCDCEECNDTCVYDSNCSVKPLTTDEAKALERKLP